MAESDNESGSQTTGNTGGGGRGGCREQDRLLPIANVGRIMKKALPANAKISKEAKETVQECVSEFISFVTGEASEKCQKEKRKTVNGDDLLWAITTLGFQDYVDPLKIYLHKYREVEGEKTSAVMVGRHHQISDQEDRDEILVGTGGVYGNSTTMMMMNNAFGSGSGSPRRTM